MSVFKRISAPAGSSTRPGTRVAALGLVCPHCHRQTNLVLMNGKDVCQLCGKAPTEK